MELLRGGNSRRIALAVAAVVRAVRSDVPALWRLRELPDLREANAALGGAWRGCGGVYRKNTPRGGRAGVVDRPVNDLASAGALANVFRSNDIAVIFRRDAGAVDASAESDGRDG